MIYPEAGGLKMRVELMRAVRTPTTGGMETTSGTSLGSFWALVKRLTGTEQVTAEQNQSVTTHEVWLRGGGPILTNQDWLIWKGKKLEIQDINDVDGLGVWTVIKTKEADGI